MARIRYDANATQAIKAAKDLAKAQEEIAKGADKSATAFGKADKEVRRFIKSAEGPQQRYNRQLAQTAELQKRGLITQKQATQAVTEYRNRLDRVGQANKTAFGGQTLENIKSYATGVLGASAALAGVQRILSQLQQQEAEAAQRTQTSLSGFGELQQISATDADFQRRKNLANEILKRGITADEGASATLAFRLDSAGLDAKDTKLFLKIGEQKFVRPQDLGGLAAATTTAQVAIGKDETGSRRDLINKSLETAANIDANATQVLKGVAKFGTNLKALGFTDEAGFAALEIATQARGNIGEGSTLVTAGLKAIEKSGVSEGGLISTIEAINARRKLGENVKGILGTDDNEAITAIRVLGNNIVDLKRFQKDITRAQTEDPLGKRLGFLQNDPVLGPALGAAKAKGRLREVRNRRLSPLENLAQSAADDIEARRLEENASKSARFFNFLDRYFGAVTDEDFLQLTQTNSRFRVSDQQLNQDIIEKLDRIANATEGTNGRVSSQPITGLAE